MEYSTEITRIKCRFTFDPIASLMTEYYGTFVEIPRERNGRNPKSNAPLASSSDEDHHGITVELEFRFSPFFTRDLLFWNKVSKPIVTKQIQTLLFFLRENTRRTFEKLERVREYPRIITRVSSLKSLDNMLLTTLWRHDRPPLRAALFPSPFLPADRSANETPVSEDDRPTRVVVAAAAADVCVTEFRFSQLRKRRTRTWLKGKENNTSVPYP